MGRPRETTGATGKERYTLGERVNAPFEPPMRVNIPALLISRACGLVWWVTCHHSHGKQQARLARSATPSASVRTLRLSHRCGSTSQRSLSVAPVGSCGGSPAAMAMETTGATGKERYTLGVPRDAPFWPPMQVDMPALLISRACGFVWWVTRSHGHGNNRRDWQGALHARRACERSV